MRRLAIITGIKDPREIKRKSRARTKPGERITLWRLLSMLEEFHERLSTHDGPGAAVYVQWLAGRFPEPRHVPLLYLMRLQFQTVVNAALEGRIFECLYLDPDPICRCKTCDMKRVKNPRGPRKKKSA